MRLEQFIVFENDPQMEYFCAPGTIHRFEKLIYVVCLEEFIALKNDPEVKYFCAAAERQKHFI